MKRNIIVEDMEYKTFGSNTANRANKRRTSYVVGQEVGFLFREGMGIKATPTRKRYTGIKTKGL
jgi:hypothetical protein